MGNLNNCKDKICEHLHDIDIYEVNIINEKYKNINYLKEIKIDHNHYNIKEILTNTNNSSNNIFIFYKDYIKINILKIIEKINKINSYILFKLCKFIKNGFIEINISNFKNCDKSLAINLLNNKNIKFIESLKLIYYGNISNGRISGPGVLFEEDKIYIGLFEDKKIFHFGYIIFNNCLVYKGEIYVN